MKVLVTGATGMVGNNVVRLLLARGTDVRVLVRASSSARPLAGLTVEMAAGDVRDEAAVRQAVAGVTHVIHAAAHLHIGWTGLDAARAVNVNGTRRVAEAALAAGARFVHVSSVDALGIGSRNQPANEQTPRTGNPLNSYVVSKREAEDAVQAAIARGLDAVIVNPSFMLGPWDWQPSSGRMLLDVGSRFIPLAPSGGGSAGDVRDVAAGIVAALHSGRVGENYILAGHNVPYFDLWRLFSKVGGSRPAILPMGPLQRYAVGFTGDLVTKLTGREPAFNSAMLAMSALWHYYDSAKAAAELGYTNRPLEQTVTEAWEWLKRHHLRHQLP